MTPPDLLAPPASPAVAPVPFTGPPVPANDRADLALETARQPGGNLDVDSWIYPSAERVAEFVKREPDQRLIDRAAYAWMLDGATAQAEGTGGGIADNFKEGLRVYRDFRRARGEEPFKFLPAARTRAEERAAREQVPFFTTLFSDPEKMAAAFPAEHRQEFEARFTGSFDPIKEKHQTAGIMLVSTMLGKTADEVAELWPVYRQKYGNEHLGLSGQVDDAAFYQAAGKAFQQETKDDETARDIAQKAQHAAIQGKPLAQVVTTGKSLTGDQWKRFEPAARAAYAGVLSEFSDPEIKSGRALFEAVADIEGKKVEDISKGDGKKAAWVIALEQYGAADQPTRDRMMALIGLQAQAEGEDITNYFERVGAATRGGKIGALAHAVFEEAKAAMKLTDDSARQIGGKTAAEKADAKADELRTMLEGTPDLTDEQIAELDGRISAVELFGDYGNANSARLEEALGFLNGTYAEGREEWLEVLTARRDIRQARVAIVEAAMGRAGPITDAERNAMKRRFEGTLTRLDEGIMQAGLSGSQKIRRLAELSEDPEIAALTDDMEMAFLDAENAESDTNDADSKALATAMRKIFGTSTEYGTAKKLRELTTATGPAPVEKIEGRKVEKVKVPVKFAEAILAGDLSGLEAGGEKFAEEVKAFDDHDLAQLELEWEQFTDLPETEQARKRNLTFERIVADGARMTIGQVNQLEGLQLYLTMKQPDQAAKLARLGYDEQTLAQLEAWLKPETLALGAWMVDHIGAEAFTLDSIHRAEKGVGLKLVENYFPVRNDVAGADNTGLSINGGAIQHTGKSIGAIKERVSNNAPPAYVNAVAVFLANRAQVNFWKSHVATLREWGGVKLADIIRRVRGS